MSKDSLLNVRKHIKEKGYTLEKLAKELNTTQSAITQTLSKNPSLNKLESIANVLGISVVELLSDTQNNTSRIICPKCGTPLNIEIKEQE